MTDDEQLKAAERGPFEEWAIRSGAAWRDPQIGVCFYSAGDGNPSWKAWLARAALRAAPGLADLQAIVDQQAEDEGLWFVARTAPEAYLQQELRRLHAAIEAAPGREPAAAVPPPVAQPAVAWLLDQVTWDEHGAIEPKELSWESIARVALDYLRAGPAAAPAVAQESRDAARYRMLRDTDAGEHAVVSGNLLRGEKLDACLDALKEQP